MPTNLPLLSLAAGVLPDIAPEGVVRAAAAAGFQATGVWFDPETWTDATTRQVTAALADTGLIALDMEPIFVTPTGDHGDRLIDEAAEVGARNILTVSRGVEPAEFTARFAELCQRAKPARMSVCVEFGRVFTIPDLPTALAVVSDCGQSNAGVLVDNLHLARAGHTAADLVSAPPEVLPYAQLCDAPASLLDDSLGAMYNEATTGRLNLGAGELPIGDVLSALPAGIPISLEIRSNVLAKEFPDPVERATSVLRAAQRVLTPLMQATRRPP